MTNEYVQDLRTHISALSSMGNALLPVILQTTANGKAPSLINPNGSVSLIKGREGWSPKQFEEQIELASKHRKSLGLAIQPPEGLLIIDLDAKQYEGGQAELMADYQRMVQAVPELRNTRTEETRNGGLHIYVRVEDLSTWQKPDGKLLQKLTTGADRTTRGEILASHNICVTAPSYGCYRLLDGTPIDQVITLASLETLGIHPSSPAPQKIDTRPRLRDLLGLKATKVLTGQYAYSDTNSGKKDRTLQLTGFAKEAYGCENMVHELGADVSETADDLIEVVIHKFNLQDKADRVLETIEDNRANYKPSRPDVIRQTLGVQVIEPSRKQNITAHSAEQEAIKAFGQIRERIRNGEIVLGDGQIIERDELEWIYIELSKLTPYQWSQGLAKHTILKIASQNRYDHIQEHFVELAANNIPLPTALWARLDQLLFGIDDPIVAMFMPKFLIGAVSRLMQPGCPYVPTPILIGPQGIGKSASAKVLFGPEFVVDDLGHKLDKDDLARAHGFFCTELSEVDGITQKAQKEQFKAFLTKPVDVYRPPYGASNITRSRSFVFWGTSNSVPLNDPSGSRRFVAINLSGKSKSDPIPLDQIAQYRGAIWARAFLEYSKGTTYELTADEAAHVASQNELFTVDDSWADCLERKLKYHPQHTCLSIDDACRLIDLQTAQQNQANLKRLREVLESLGYKPAKILLPNGERAKRLARQTGCKHIQVDVDRCLMGRY